MALRSNLALVVVAMGLAMSSRANAQAAAWGGGGSDDEEDEAEAKPGEKKKKKPEGAPSRVPWRGSSISMSAEASAQLLGIGKDYQSSDYLFATLSWSAWLNYFLYEGELDSVRITAAPSFQVELTNSGDTVTKREVQFGDTPIWATYSRSLFRKDLWATSFSFWARVVLPTNPYSYRSGTYFTTTPWLWLMQTFPLAGKKSPVFKTATLGFLTRWDHRFGKATTPVNSDLERPRQTATGETFLSDQLAPRAMGDNTIMETLMLRFDEQIVNMPLTVLARWSFTQTFLPSFHSNPCPATVNYGQTCVAPGANPDQRTTRYGWGFDFNVIFQPIAEGGIWLAYGNFSPNMLSADGTRRWSPFWSPNASLSASILLYPDAIYERLAFGTGRSIAKRDSKTKKF